MTEQNKNVKQEYIASKVAEGLNENVVKEEWNKFEQEFRKLGFSDEELHQRVKRRMISYYLLQNRNPTEKFKAVFIGFKDNDYGARRQYIKAKKAYQENPDQAIADGLVNEMGMPLKQNGYDKGSVIDIEDAEERTMFGIVKKEGEDKYTYGKIKGKKVQSPKPVLFKEVEFAAGVSQKSTNDEKHLYFKEQTKFNIIHELDKEEVKTLLGKYYKDSLENISNLAQWAEENRQNYDKLAIIKGDVYQMIDDPNRMKVDEITGEKIRKASVLGLNDGHDNPSFVGCIVPPEIELNFNELAQDVIVVGRAGVRQNDEDAEPYMIAFGVFAPKEFHVEKEGHVEPEVKTEEKVEVGNEDW